MARYDVSKDGINTRFSNDGSGLSAVECAKRSQAVQREKKLQAMREMKASELVCKILNSDDNSKMAKKISKELGIAEDEPLTQLATMIGGQTLSAKCGNSKSFQALMELQKLHEEKEAQKEAERLAKLNKTYHMDLYDIPDSFHSSIRDIRDEQHQEYIFKGGRGSTKSSTVAMMIVELIKNNHDIHAVVCRKVGNTLKDSVYSKLKWAINKQGLNDDFEFHKSPLEITYKPTGQKIYFRGADEPEKIKSISPEFGYIAILWFEEIDQFFGQEEIRNITQSAIRGGDKAWIFKSYNPPRNANSWINKYVQIPKENMIVHTSNYTEVPRSWLGQPFIDEAEHLKAVNPTAYEHEYMGVPVGNGTEVFDNLECREITDEEIANFEHLYHGVDWGWSPDPFQYVCCEYDSNREIIYIFEEFRANKMTNEETARVLIEDYGLTHNDVVTCDSAEKKSIADYRAYGINARAVEKGPESVRYGMKWLQSRAKIVIDPIRCPNAWKEFSEYEYELTREGEPTGSYPDMNNHSIDALRYSLFTIWKRKGK